MTRVPIDFSPAGKGHAWPWIPSPVDEALSGEVPKISIVTPSFNQAAYLEAAIRSVLLQGYPNLEYFVMDGGSTDGSVDIIRKYAPHLTFWESGPDRGQSHAINKGFTRATGEILYWLNSDDYLLPGALEKVARAFQRQPDAAAWVGAVRTVTPDGKMVYTHEPFGLSLEKIADWSRSGGFSQPGCFLSGVAVRAAGPLREDLHYAMDVEYWLRLLRSGRFEAVGEILACETFHAAAKTQACRGESMAELHMVQMGHGFTEIVRKRMAEELEELSRFRKNSFVDRLRWSVNLLIRPWLEKWSRKQK